MIWACLIIVRNIHDIYTTWYTRISPSFSFGIQWICIKIAIETWVPLLDKKCECFKVHSVIHSLIPSLHVCVTVSELLFSILWGLGIWLCTACTRLYQQNVQANHRRVCSIWSQNPFIPWAAYYFPFLLFFLILLFSVCFFIFYICKIFLLHFGGWTVRVCPTSLANHFTRGIPQFWKGWVWTVKGKLYTLRNRLYRYVVLYTRLKA